MTTLKSISNQLDSLRKCICNLQKQIDEGGGGGGDTLLALSGSNTATGNVIGDLDGHDVTLSSDGNVFFEVNAISGAEGVFINPTDGIGSASIEATSSNGGYHFGLDANSGVNEVTIFGDAPSNTITYIAGFHNVQGNVQVSTSDYTGGLLFAGSFGASTGLVVLGDADGGGNSTFIRVDDASHLITFNGNTVFPENGTPDSGKVATAIDTDGNWAWQSAGAASFSVLAPLAKDDTIIYQRYNVLEYGADPSGVADSTVAIQAAIQAAIDNTGGDVIFPIGTYLISGALNPTSNSQLYIPASPVNDRLHIRLIGETRPNCSPVGGSLPGSSAPVITAGVILKSDITVGAAGAAVIGAMPTNYNSVSVENLAIIVAHDPAGDGPVVGGFSWHNATSNMWVNNCAISIDIVAVDSTEPTNDVSGVETPIDGQSDLYRISNTVIVGFKNGIKLSEHCYMDGNNIWTCSNGILASGGFHNNYGSRVGIQWCTNDITFENTYSRLIMTGFDDEHIDAAGSGGKWFDNVYTINDPSNLGFGYISFSGTKALTGVDSVPVKNGAAFVSFGTDGSPSFLTKKLTLQSVNSDATLELRNTTAAGLAHMFLYNDSNQGVLIGKLGSSYAGFRNGHASDFFIHNDSGGNLSIHTESGNINFLSGTSSTPLVVINDTSVGIGQTSPTHPLDIVLSAVAPAIKIVNSNSSAYGGITAFNDANSGMYLYKLGSGYGGYKIMSASDGALYTDTGDMAFLVETGGFKWAGGFSSVAQMTLDSAGSLLLGTTTDAPCAILNATSTSRGVLLPRMTKAQRNAISTPLAGLAIYQTDNTPGLRVYNGTNWMKYTETAD